MGQKIPRKVDAGFNWVVAYDEIPGDDSVFAAFVARVDAELFHERIAGPGSKTVIRDIRQKIGKEV